MKLKMFLSFFITLNAQAYEYPYKVLPLTYVDNPTSVVEIKESSPVKTQDGIGFCYGFSSTSLLENYRCREEKIDCSNPKEALSSFDVTSYYGLKRNELIEGGNAYSVLKKIKNSPRLIAREQCIPFSSIVHQVKNKKNEFKGMQYLMNKWDEYKGTDVKKGNDCVSCLANDIKKTLMNLQTPAEQISEAFTTATNVEDFLYKAILPKDCLSEANAAKIPEFDVYAYPDGRKPTTDEMLSQKIESVLNRGIPMELGICADDQGYTKTCEGEGGHSVALFGIKEVCDLKKHECRKVVKVKNSYGKNWQTKNNDGWVDLAELVKSSLSLSSFHNITWIEKPGMGPEEDKAK